MSGTSYYRDKVRVLVNPVVGLSQDEYDIERRIISIALKSLNLQPIWELRQNKFQLISEVAAAEPEENILGIGGLVWTSELEHQVDVPLYHLRPSDYLLIKRSAYLWVRKGLLELVCSRAFQMIGIAFLFTALLPAFLITLIERTVDNSRFFGASSGGLLCIMDW